VSKAAAPGASAKDNDRAGRRQGGHLFGKRAFCVVCALVSSER
jgi:hypothetical protein